MSSPNIILIVLDTARAKNFSCYGYPKKTTPFLETFAQDGVLYKQAISPACWTLPSHTSMFTGQYPHTHKINQQGDCITENIVTLAEFLSDLGYCTAGFTPNGWISDFTKLNRGFQYFYLYEDQSLVRKLYHLSNSVLNRLETFVSLSKSGRSKPTKLRETSSNPKLITPFHNLQNWLLWFFAKNRDSGASNINEKIKSWLDQLCTSESGKPFFIFVNYTETHARYDAPLPYRYMFAENQNLREKKIWNINQDHNKYLTGETGMDRLDFQLLEALYNGEIRYLDYQLRQIQLFLKKKEMYDNSIIIITSDHGENIGDHGLMAHRLCLYDTLIWVPLIIKYPQRFSRTGNDTRLVSTLDIFPTIIDLLAPHGHKVLSQIEGNSLISNRIRNRDFSYAISELLGQRIPNGTPKARQDHYNRELISLRSKKHKYIWSTNGKHEFYDLANDPDETTNLINTDHPKLRESRNLLNPWLKSFKKVAGSPKKDKEPMSEKIKKRLQDLGYL